MVLTEYDEQFHIACEKEESRQEGLRQGLELGKEQGIQALIVTCAELGLSRPDITEKVSVRFSLSKEASEKYVDTWIPTEK